MEQKTARDLSLITIIFLLASIVLYGYFSWFTKGGMETVYRNWDGPAYVVVAKSFYNPKIIAEVNNLPYIERASYFSQEFPLYPVFIRMFSFLGYDQSMIFVSQLFSLLFVFAVYLLVKKIEPGANALVIGLLLIFYVPRWFVVSHVGSSEPVFMFLITLFWLLYQDKRVFLSSLALGLAQLARLPGAFFFFGVVSYGLLRRVAIQKLLPFMVVPAFLVGLFLVYQMKLGNFWAAIDEYSAHAVTQWPPFQNFTSPEGYYDIWKEGVLLIHIFYAIAIAIVFQKKLYFLAFTSLPYYLYLFFVHHSDMSRYLLPLLPLIAIAFAPALSKKSVYIPLFLFIPLVYLIAISYISYNVAGVL